MGYSKRFSSDLLQRSYDQLAELFGCSKGQATDAIVYLEKMGVVQRVFRTQNINGVICSNILYLQLDVTQLKALTYPEETSQGEVSPNSSTPPSEIPEGCPEISGEVSPKFHQTNTEITPKTTPEITPSIYQRQTATTKADCIMDDGVSEEELREEVEYDLCFTQAIPYAYVSHKRKMEVAIKTVSDWYEIREIEGYFKTDFETYAFDLLVDCLSEMLCDTTLQTYKGSSVSYSKILDKVNDCMKASGGIAHFITETIDDYIQAASVTEIRDKRKYMKAVIWNSLSTYQVKFQSMFERTYYGDTAPKNRVIAQ